MDPASFGNYIDGEWMPAASGKTFENRNPADTSELVGRFADSGAEDVERAVAAAKAAYPRWKALPAPKRAEILYRAAELLVRRKEEHARDMTREMGKVLDGDSRRRAGSHRHDVLHGRRGAAPVRPDYAVGDAGQVRDVGAPAGGDRVIITPWNFPMAIPSWKVMPALVLGNTVVIKPASDTPLSSYNLVQALTEAGVPRGVINLVTVRRQSGHPLMVHKHAKLVSFTGSTEIGRVSARRAQRISSRANWKWAART